MDDESRLRAACRGANPELFFPIGNVPTQIRQAKTICAGCPVAVECLTDALDAGTDYGIWGGLTADERRAHRRSLIERDAS